MLFSRSIHCSFLFLLASGAFSACASRSVSREPTSKPDLISEIKVSLAPSELGELTKLLGLKVQDARYRSIYFLDTPDLALFHEGSVLRSRNTHNKLGAEGDSDTTVKLRPLESSKVDAKWFSVEGFKCESDETLVKSVMSCSLTSVHSKRKIEEAVSKLRPLSDVFSKEQVEFLSLYAQDKIPWDLIVSLGPIRSRTWKAEVKELGELSIEEWTLPNSVTFLELSLKGDASDSTAAKQKLKGYLESHRLALGEDQETKTRAALKFLTPPKPR